MTITRQHLDKFWNPVTRERYEYTIDPTMIGPGRHGGCPCGNLTEARCACGGWWCGTCLSLHTSGPDGRCVRAMALERALGLAPLPRETLVKAYPEKP